MIRIISRLLLHLPLSWRLFTIVHQIEPFVNKEGQTFSLALYFIGRGMTVPPAGAENAAGPWDRLKMSLLPGRLDTTTSRQNNQLPISGQRPALKEGAPGIAISNFLGGNIVKPPDDTPKLADLGISKIQSHRWQVEAEVPEPKFEQWMTETKA